MTVTVDHSDASSLSAAALLSNERAIGALESLLAERLQARVRHLQGEAIEHRRADPKGAAKNKRAYTRHVLSVSGPVRGNVPDHLVQDGTLTVFVKSAAQFPVSALDTMLATVTGRGFRAPFFFGTTTCDGLQIGAWEHIPHRTLGVNYGRVTPAERRRLVEVVAGYNSLTPQADVPVLTKWGPSFFPPGWTTRIAARLGKLDDETRRALAATERALALQPELYRRIAALGERYLTHNDFGPHNIYVPPLGDIIVIDWEAASLSAPGVDLRFLTREEHDDLLSHYLACMAGFGIMLEREDVWLACEVTKAYLRLRSGWGKRRVDLVQRGLAILERYHAD